VRSVSLLTLRSRIATRYNLPTLGSNSWISTTELNTEINASLQRFYALLMDCSGDDYFASYTDITTSDGVDLTSMPAGFMRALNVTWLRDTDDPVQLEQASARDARKSGLIAQSWDSYTPTWAPHGLAAIRWFPTPNATYTVRVTYSKIPADLAADADTFDAGLGWEEWVVNDVCAAALCPREERDPSVYVTERDRMELRIRDQAPVRGDTSGGLLLDNCGPERMGSWELRNWLTRGGH
jgi:hypothetical protein